MDRMKPRSALEHIHRGEQLFNSQWLFVVVVCLLYLPFLGQAFHIDDVGFINPSKAIGWNPLTVKAGANDYFYGLPEERKGTVGVPYEGTHSMLMPYFIKIISALVGEKEIIFHAVYLIFPIIALVAFSKLSSILFRSSPVMNRSLLYLLVAMPAFLVNSHTIMSDVPSLALLLASMVFFCLAVEHNAPAPACAGGLSLTAAVFMTYQMLAFIPVIFFYVVLKKKLSKHIIANLLLPIFFLAVWLLAIYNLYGVFPLLKGSGNQGGEVIALEIRRGLLSEVFIGKVIATFAHIGASLFFALILYVRARNSFLRYLAGLGALTTICLFTAGSVVDYPFVDVLILSCMVAIGILSVYAITRTVFASAESGDRPRNYFLLFWAFTVIVYNIFALPFGAARYILPALPPMLLILLNVRQGSGSESGGLKSISVILACALIFGWMSSYSDYRYAQTYRYFAQEAKIFRTETAGAGTVWYTGRWGMQYYMEKEGFHMPSSASRELKKGDFIVLPEMPQFWQPSPELLPRLKTYATRQFVSPVPLRLFNRRSNAGFYAHHWGLLPFSFSRAPDETFLIVEVTS